ncbi:esterase/lipase family protein [Streptomyces liliiviolaceus]|nr:alpha/beta hydrolase [Streptomyces liliiviolaceus]
MQRSLKRLTLFLSAVLALAFTMLTVMPAGAAPSHSDGSRNRVIFVHGFAPTGKHDCAKYFSSARKHFKNKNWKGNLLTFGYYKGDKNCSYRYKNGTRNKSLNTVAKVFANYVADNYSSKNEKVDVVAHSMGGLIVRAALYHSSKGTPGFPKKLYIEDVVTLGTPHGGTKAGYACSGIFAQCKEMKPRSAFLKSLGTAMPKSNRRTGWTTDWTTVSSYNDGVVSEASGIAGIAKHEVQYQAGIGHNELKTVHTGRHKSRIKHPNWSAWSKRVSPVEQARLSVLLSSM